MFLSFPSSNPCKTSSFLIPHSSFLIPHSSFLIPTVVQFQPLIGHHEAGNDDLPLMHHLVVLLAQRDEIVFVVLVKVELK